MNNIKKAFIFFFLLAITFRLAAQSRVNDWKHYTSILKFTDITAFNNKVYCASGGGIVTFDPEIKTFTTITDGLSRINLETITTDATGNIWTGSGAPKGEINIVQEGQVIKIFDESTWNDTFTSIKAFAGTENRMFAVCQINTDWGLLEFDTEYNYNYKDYYFNFPVSFQEIHALSISGDNLYLTTSNHLLCGNYKTDDLKDPATWEIIHEATNISNTVLFDDKVIYAKGNDLYAYDGESSSFFMQDLNGTINHLAVNHEKLILATSAGTIKITKNKEYITINDISLRKIHPLNNQYMAIHDGAGLITISESEAQQYIPNTSLSNINTAICVDNQNRIIAGAKSGISILKKEGWHNIVRVDKDEEVYKPERNWNYFTGDSLHYSKPSRIYSIVERSDGYIFASLYDCNIKNSNGVLLKFNPDDLTDIEKFDTTNGYLSASEGFPGGNDHWLAVGRMELDPTENLWICNQIASNGNFIAVLKKDGSWVHFNHSYLGSHPTSIAFDQENRVWIGDEKKGIVVLAYGDSLNNKSDDNWFRISQSDGIGSNEIFDMTFDHNGTLFLMTSAGIQEIEVTSDFSSNNYFSRINTNPTFSNIPFQKENVIKVDGQNNKWITTVNSGVKVYTWDNYWLNNYDGYTIDNSDLLSNEVFDIDFIEEDGLVVMSTKNGISVLKSQFSSTKDDYSSLKIFPMPYKIPEAKDLVIEGLLPNSAIKIITLNGTFIRKLTQNKGEVIGTQGFWDGRDMDGNLVSSGVYLCMAYTDDGKKTVGKIAVIRRN